MKRVLLCFALLTLFIPPPQLSATTKGRCPTYEPMFRKYGLPVEVFSYISWRESRCNHRSVSAPNGNGSIDIGLVQINSSWRTLTARTCRRPANQVVKSLTTLSCNLKVAAVLWDNGKGASNWRVSSHK